MPARESQETWLLYQLSKSRLFHQKLHEWAMLETAQVIEAVEGEKLDWVLPSLGISEQAWKRVIHQGIKPVRVFAHPAVLTSVERAVSYYRMLSMVSQKSMGNIGLAIEKYENGAMLPNEAIAIRLTHHLNAIISALIEADDEINIREFDIWRGMGAGAQAQGSSVNQAGRQTEATVQSLIRQRLIEKDLIAEGFADEIKRINLRDGRIIEFRSDPDIAVYDADGTLQVVIEVKGGIDSAGALERLGATLRSFGYARESGDLLTSIVIVQAVALTSRTRTALEGNAGVDHWFTVEELTKPGEQQEKFFTILGI